MNITKEEIAEICERYGFDVADAAKILEATHDMLRVEREYIAYTEGRTEKHDLISEAETQVLFFQIDVNRTILEAL